MTYNTLIACLPESKEWQRYSQLKRILMVPVIKWDFTSTSIQKSVMMICNAIISAVFDVNLHPPHVTIYFFIPQWLSNNKHGAQQ